MYIYYGCVGSYSRSDHPSSRPSSKGRYSHITLLLCPLLLNEVATADLLLSERGDFQDTFSASFGKKDCLKLLVVRVPFVDPSIAQLVERWTVVVN